MNARMTKGAVTLAVVLIAPLAHAQEAGPRSEPPPVIVSIAGPCALALDGHPAHCTGVAYIAFPSSHRIDFTVIGAGETWAFSGEDDDNDKGQYSLTVDGIIGPGADGRMEADGECDMDVAEDGRTVRSIDCHAKAGVGELTLKASGVIAASSGAEEDDDEDEGPGAKG
jgi:hypothetical protein